MQNYNIYSIICNYKKVWHIKPDHLVSLYILLEKHEKNALFMQQFNRSPQHLT